MLYNYTPICIYVYSANSYIIVIIMEKHIFFSPDPHLSNDRIVIIC